MVSPVPPPPAPLDLPEPSLVEQRSLYRLNSKIDPPFYPPSTSLDTISTEPFSTGLSSQMNQPTLPLSPIERSETPPPPLRNLASKFANMINLNAAVPMFGSSAEDPASAVSYQNGPRAKAHNRSQSLGYFFGASGQLDQENLPPVSTANRNSMISALPDLDVGPGLSGEEIERLAKEERDWSRREAEKLMKLDKKENDGPRKKEQFGEGRGPRRLTSSRSMRDLTQHQSNNPLPSAPSTVFPMPSTTSAYLVPASSDPTTLDIPGTLALLAKRFEKLETWSVGHVKALEDRVGKFDHRLGALEGRTGSQTDEVEKLRDELNRLREALSNGLGELEGRFGRSLQEAQLPPRSSFDTEPVTNHFSSDMSRASSLRRTGSTSSSRSRPLPPSPCPLPEQSFQPHQYQYQYQQPPQPEPGFMQQEFYSAPHSETASSSVEPDNFAPVYSHPHSPNVEQQSITIDTEDRTHMPQLLTTPTPSLSPPTDRPTSPAVPPRKRYTSALSSRPPSAQGNHSVSGKEGMGLEDSADGLSASEESSSNSTSTLASSASLGVVGPRAPSRGARAEDKLNTGSISEPRSAQGAGSRAGSTQNQAKQKEVILASNGKRAKVGAIVDFWDKGSRK